MRLPWRKPQDVGDRSAEIDAAVQSNELTRAEAEATRAANHHLSARVARIHAALMHEGAQNHFTERIETALRGSR